MIEAFNLRTTETRVYTCSPAQAVRAAYAQERGDWNTWEYATRYTVEEGVHTVACGDWCALKGKTP